MRSTLLRSLPWWAWGTCLSATAALAHSDRPCPCVHPDGVAQQGEVVCLEVDGKRQLARCEMRLNNASWHFLGTSCGPTAMIDGAADGPSAASWCAEPAWGADATDLLGQIDNQTSGYQTTWLPTCRPPPAVAACELGLVASVHR